MISNVKATEIYQTNRGWSRNVSWEHKGSTNTVECSSNNQYTDLIKTLVDAQVDKKVPYSRVTYVRSKK